MRPVLLHSGLSSFERQLLKDQFQQSDDQAHIIVGTGKILGTGLTLNRAVRTILLEQDSSAADWKQYIARMHWCGNLNWAGFYVYEFCTTNGPPLEAAAKQWRLNQYKLYQDTMKEIERMLDVDQEEW